MIKSLKFTAVILIFSLLTSCKVMLIGAYDDVTDQTFQKVQNEVYTAFTKIDKGMAANNPDEYAYETMKDFYTNVEGQLSSLLVRCNSLPKYRIVHDQDSLLIINIKNLETLHKMGLNPVAYQQAKKFIEMNFMDISKLQSALKSQKLTD